MQRFSKKNHPNDLMPDGVRIYVDWDNFPVSASVFVPCINTSRLQVELAEIAGRLGWKFTSRVRIENGVYGLRFWRMV